MAAEERSEEPGPLGFWRWEEGQEEHPGHMARGGDAVALE